MNPTFLDASRLRIRASVICRHNDRLLTVCAVDPLDGARYLFLPGGGIESNESPAEAGVRETREETGYVVSVSEPPLVFDYRFLWSGKWFDCRTHFFRGELVDPKATATPTHDDGYIRGVEWCPVERIDEVFAYHRTILTAVKQLTRSE